MKTTCLTVTSSQNFIWRNQTALLVIVAKSQVLQKAFQYILKNTMLVFSIMVLCLYGAMVQWLGHWIPSSKPLRGFKVKFVFHSYEYQDLLDGKKINCLLVVTLQPCRDYSKHFCLPPILIRRLILMVPVYFG